VGWDSHVRGMVIVSACLAGVRCRYDGESRAYAPVVELVRSGRAIPVCPEQLGGLPTPRPRAEIVGGDGVDVLKGQARVLAEDGRDVTAFFVRGARETARLAALSGSEVAVLKDGSPSCGCVWISDGGFSGGRVRGVGVAAAALADAGVEVRPAGDAGERSCGEEDSGAARRNER